MKLHVMIFKCAGKFNCIREITLDPDIQTHETNRILVQVLSQIEYRKNFQMSHILVVSKTPGKEFTRLFPAPIIYSSNFGQEWYKPFDGVSDECQAGVHDECNACDCLCHPQLPIVQDISKRSPCPYCGNTEPLTDGGMCNGCNQIVSDKQISEKLLTKITVPIYCKICGELDIVYSNEEGKPCTDICQKCSIEIPKPKVLG